MLPSSDSQGEFREVSLNLIQGMLFAQSVSKVEESDLVLVETGSRLESPICMSGDTRRDTDGLTIFLSVFILK